MPETVEKALELKQKLIDFVYDAEGEMAIALESYAAAKGKHNSYGIKQQNLTIDLFTTAGNVNQQTPLEMFLASATDLDSQELELIRLWQGNFIGLFEIQAIETDSYQLMNWLTAKTYQVCGHSLLPEKETQRWQPGEIILAILAPLDSAQWFFFSDRIIKGRLSQPKLAVAIGEFRDNYPDFLYADAPELLSQAWSSVAVYHQQFVEHFGSDHLTLPGYKLNQEIGKLQQKMSQKKLAEAGIDSSKSLADVLTEAGKEQAEFTEVAEDLGINAQAVDKLVANQDKLSMATPKLDLPPEIKQAETVTAYSHPKWGQMFLPGFDRFIDLLNSPGNSSEELSLLAGKYLEKPEANYYVWQQLAQEYPSATEKVLQEHLKRNNFQLESDLADLLIEYNKPSTPELPAIASVPIHLNNLFEAAVAQVQKTKSKSKKKKKKKGFQ
ncbi:MAG: hypothetical protein AAFY63_03505 [Cyanobacteria bacterium J06643_13]